MPKTLKRECRQIVYLEHLSVLHPCAIAGVLPPFIALLRHGLVICGFISKLWQNVSRIINIIMATKHAHSKKLQKE